MNVWQVAAGDGSRDYADIFLKFGVILVGPGSEGNYFENKHIYNDPNHWSYRPFIPHPTCKIFIVSDGIRYKLFKKDDNQWNYCAYMNLMVPKQRHPYLKEVKGAVDFFLNMMP